MFIIRGSLPYLGLLLELDWFQIVPLEADLAVILITYHGMYRIQYPPCILILPHTHPARISIHGYWTALIQYPASVTGEVTSHFWRVMG
jgi:hypothetical protein